ncbi:MAG: VIT domain-containing protein [bacterium JZ-2024 1]
MSMKERNDHWKRFRARAMRRQIVEGIVAAFSLAFLTGAAEPRRILPPPVPMPPVFPITPDLRPVSLEVDADVDRMRVSATYSLRFKNSTGAPAEGTILIPVPGDVSVERFTMRVGEELLGGELLTAEEARRLYEEIVRRRRDPAILSFVGESALSVRIFPVPPGEERTLEVRWTGILPREGSEFRITLPLKMSLAGISERISVRVHIYSENPLTTVYSPVDGVHIVRDTSRSAVLRYEATGDRAPTIWKALFSTTRDPLDITVIPYRDTGEDGYALLIISPGLPEDESYTPKNFILIADVSGSMAGDKLRNLKEGGRFILHNLRAGDYFNIIAFESRVRLFEESSVPATEANLTRALQFLEALEAVGGTNIYEALVEGLSLPRSANLPTYLLFITDGLPTVGVTRPEEILQAVRKMQTHDRARIFVLGVGLDVNVALLDLLARENGGASEYVQTGPELEQRLSDLYRKLKSPVVTNARVTVQGVRAYDILPADPLDFFAGSQTVVALRYSGYGRAEISLEGNLRGSSFRLSRTTTFPERDLDDPYVVRIWATRKIASLLDEIRLKGESRELIDSIIQLSQKYGVMTPYTDFLVLEPGIRADEAERRFRSGSLGGGAPGSLARPPSPKAAEQAQAASQDLARLAQSYTVTTSEPHLKVCNARSFIFRNNRWEELTFSEVMRSNPSLKPIKLAFLSDEYFTLVNQHPDLKECFSISGDLVVKVGDQWYEIVSGESEKSQSR